MKSVAVIVSEYASANLGDQAISRSLADILSPRFEVKFLSFGGIAQPSLEIEAITKTHKASDFLWFPRIVPAKIRARIRWYLLGDRNKFKEHCRHSFRHSSLVFIGGGQLIKNNIALFCERLFLIGKLANNQNLPFTLIGVGVDRKMSRLTWNLASDALRTCQFIIARDELSRQRIRENVKNAADCHVLPDLVFALKIPPFISTTEPRSVSIGINIMQIKTMLIDTDNRPNANYATIITSYCELIKHANRDGLVVNFFTSGSTEDLIEAKNIKKAILEQIGVEVPVFHPGGLDDLLNFLSQVKDVIAARMHAGILAYIAGCNPVCLNWDDKVRGVWTAIGQEQRVIEIADFVDHNQGDGPIELLRSLRPPTESELEKISGATRAGVMNLVNHLILQNGAVATTDQ